MKRYLLLLLSFVVASSCASAIPITDTTREVNNFVFNEGTVYWQNVYQFDAKDSGAVRDWFTQSFNITREGDSSIIGETSENVLPIREAGLDRMSVIMLLTHPCTVYFNTDFKEDRFRVTVNRIIWHPNIGITTYGVTTSVSAMDLNSTALKGNGYSYVFYNTTSGQLDKMLTYLFTPKLSATGANDDW